VTTTYDLVVAALRAQRRRASPTEQCARLFRRKPTGPGVERNEELRQEYPDLFNQRGPDIEDAPEENEPC
jgi:hypothetical protein